MQNARRFLCLIFSLIFISGFIADRVFAQDAVIGYTPVRVVQYNVQFLFSPSLRTALEAFNESVKSHYPGTVRRAETIGSRPEIACADIVFLNETSADGLRDEIIRAMEKVSCGKPFLIRRENGVHASFDVVHGPDLEQKTVSGHIEGIFTGAAIIDDELTIISRFPIIETHALIFKDASGVNKFAAKGILHARLWRGGESHASDIIDAFATHLNTDHKQIQISQIDELVSFIRSHKDANPKTPIILAGDFNIDANNARSLYKTLLKKLNNDIPGELGFKDIGQVINSGATSKGGGRKNKRIDYIFVAPGVAALFPVAGAKVDFFGGFPGISPTGELSDHGAIIAEFFWPKWPGGSFE